MLTTPDVTVSFPDVVKGRETDSGGRQYSVVLLFRKDNKEHMAFLKRYSAACQEVADAMPDKIRPSYKMVGHAKSPIKDADIVENQKGQIVAEAYPEREGCYYISAACYGSKPSTVGLNSNGSIYEILDPSAFYSGAICRANINPYGRTRSDNPGVSNGLNGLMFVRDGERIGGGRPSDEEMWGQAPKAPEKQEDAGGLDDDNPFDL